MRVRVRDVMTPDVIGIEPDVPLKDAAILMARHRISGLPVVEDGRLVGIVTESDFVSRLAEDDRGLISLLFRRGGYEVTGQVRDAMTPEPLTIGPDETLEMAARAMTSHNVKRLPVVDGNARLIGVVSRADLMEVFARPDDAIADDVRRGGVESLIGAEPGSVAITVTDGIVTLEGRVGSVTEKRMLEEYSRNVAGVVAVESRLDAAFDDTRLPPM